MTQNNNILFNNLVHFKSFTNPIFLQSNLQPKPQLFENQFIFPKTLGDFISTGDTSHDYFPTELDGDPYVATYNNFTVNSGHTVTTTNRCKGMYLKILGDLTINGTLSMTARGAKAVGKYVGVYPSLGRVYFNSEDTFSDTLPKGKSLLIGPVGGVAGSGVGRNNACGGGGNGGVRVTNNAGTAGRGAAGTSFSGGAGGGGVGATGGSGAANGGAGGIGYVMSSQYIGAGGGAGNPGGAGRKHTDYGLVAAYTASSGTGGLMILIVHGNVIIGDTGSIQANGSNGGNPSGSGIAHGSAGGGGSGGGAIHIFHKGSITNIAKITVTGGARGTGSNYGYAGGAGSKSIINF